MKFIYILVALVFMIFAIISMIKGKIHDAAFFIGIYAVARIQILEYEKEDK